MNTIELLSIAYVIPFLIYAAYRDIKTREVPNALWPWMYVLSLPLIIYNVMTMTVGDRIISLFMAVLVIIVSASLMYVGYFAGADFKCLVLLSVILPTHILFVLWLSVMISLGVTATDMIIRWSLIPRKQPYLVNVLLSVSIALLLGTT